MWEQPYVSQRKWLDYAIVRGRMMIIIEYLIYGDLTVYLSNKANTVYNFQTWRVKEGIR